MTKPVELYRPGLTGCTDHNCIIQHRTGMGTNGGCNCERELQRLKPHGFNAVLTISYLRQQLESAQTEINNQAKAYGLLNKQLETAQKEKEKYAAARENLIQQVQGWAQEARTQRGIVLSIGEEVDCQNDWEMAEAVREYVAGLKQQLAQCEADARRYKEPSFDFWAIIVNGKVDVCGLSVLRNINYSATEELQDEIERYLNEEVENLPQNAVIDFIATNVSKEPGQQTFPETGQWDFLPYWDMDIEITKIEVESTAIAAEGAGEEG